MTETADDTVYGWVTLTDADALWTTVTDLEPEVVPLYLTAAHQQCVRYMRGRNPAPTESLKLAQIAQARSLARLFTVGDSGAFTGPDGQTVAVFPMDWSVKALLVPYRRRRYVR